MKRPTISEEIQRLCRKIAPFAEQDTFDELRMQRYLVPFTFGIAIVNDAFCSDAERLYPPKRRKSALLTDP